MEFKDRLKLLRSEKSISAVDLAKRLNKSESAIRMWESGKTKPDADTLIELSIMLGCTTDYLLGLSLCENESKINELSDTTKNIAQHIAAISDKDRKEIAESLNAFFDSYNSITMLPTLQAEFKYILKNFAHSIHGLSNTVLGLR